MPSRHPGEDGCCRLASVELAGAEVAAWDSATGLPLLTCYRYGKGKVYVLTAWAYPGHEALQKFSAAWVAYLAKANRGEWFVEDESSEVFWSVRRFADRRCGQISLLNTDWTQPGNRKTVRICAGNTVIEHDVVERVLLQITVAGSKLLETDNDNYLEYIGTADGKAQFKLYSTAVGEVKIYSADGVETLNLAVSPTGVPFEVSL